MKNDNKYIKKSISNLTSREINFQKINSIMNQNLVGLFDYLKASVYFSAYDIKNEKKEKNEKNLEEFFKSKIFDKKPFILNNNRKSITFNKKKQNNQLNIIINIKNNQIKFKKNKFTSPFMLHSKKSHFLKNMVEFSKNIHSEEKKEENIKKKYPKLESISLNSTDFHNFAENQVFLTPRISRYDAGITVERNEKFTSTKEFPRNFRSLYNFNFNNFIPMKFKDNMFLSKRNKINSARAWFSLDNSKENDYKDLKRKFKLRIRNLYERNRDENSDFGKINYYNSNSKSNSNCKQNSDIKKNKTQRMIKSLKPNCYYNNLHLLKLSKIFKKNSYQSLD